MVFRRWLPSPESIQDARHAFRSLRRRPGVTLVALATLAVAIGINVAVFTIANAVLFKPFPFIDDSSRIVYVDGTGINGKISYPDFEDWRRQSTSFEGMAAVMATWITLSDGGAAPEACGMTIMTPNGFQLIGQAPILGRNFTSADAEPGAERVVIISHRLWERRYGKDPSVIGRTLRAASSLNLPVFQSDAPLTIIGVMAPGFAFPLDQDLWTPLVPVPALQQRDAGGITFLFGRLREGATVQAARAEIGLIGSQLATAYPTTHAGFAQAEVQTFNDHYVGPRATVIFATMIGAVGFVLLIGCANLANLMFARVLERSREMSLRLALGSGRWRIVRQLLIESLTLSAFGGLAGWLIATVCVRAYELAGFSPFPYAHAVDLSMDARVVTYLVAVCTGTGLLFGLAPALRLSKLDLNTALKEGGRSVTGGRGAARWSQLLIVGETALAVVLLTGAGATIRSFLNVYTADVGINAEQVLSATINLPAASFPTRDSQALFFERLERQLAGLAGVESVAVATRLPVGGSLKVPFQLEGQAPLEPAQRPQLSALSVGPAYFHTLRATVVSGRAFSDADVLDSVPVAIVNQRFAQQQWPQEDAVGKGIRLFDGQPEEAWRMVVGVVSNIVQDDATRQSAGALVYLPYRQAPARFAHVLVRSRAMSAGQIREVRSAIQSQAPDLSITLLPLSQRLDRGYRDNGLLAMLFLAFAGIALALAAVGIHAIIAHAVAQRSQEIGVRIAMGGSARDVLALVLKAGMTPVGFGLACGLIASFALMPLLRSSLVDVSAMDPVSHAAALVALLVAAALGCLMPGLRALRIDPVEVLRGE